LGFLLLQELREIGVKTVWGEPSDIGAALGNIQAPFDAVLDNNGKTLDVVQYVSHVLPLSSYEVFYVKNASLVPQTLEQGFIVNFSSITKIVTVLQFWFDLNQKQLKFLGISSSRMFFFFHSLFFRTRFQLWTGELVNFNLMSADMLLGMQARGRLG
jgi:hypothetical protein